MSTTVYSMALIQGKLGEVKITCEMTSGIGIHVVGLFDSQVKESLLRVITAMQASGYRIPGKKIVVTIEPRIPKRWDVKGSQLDLPIAVAILAESGQAELNGFVLPMFCILGELSLGGQVRDFNGLSGFEIIKEGRRAFSDIVLPVEKAKEAVSLMSDTMFVPKTLKEAVELLRSTDEEEQKFSFWKSVEWRELFGRLSEMNDWSK